MPHPVDLLLRVFDWIHRYFGGLGSSVGIATELRAERSGIESRWGLFASLDLPWGPPRLLYNRYRVFPGGKVRPVRATDHSPPSISATVMEE